MRRVSIVTINRNNIRGLKQTIQSVKEQTYKDFEFVIVDGASTDGSADVVLSDRCDERVISVSEPDSGIYNAMNKGVRMASGEYLLFLNSGDTFASHDSLERSIEYLCNHDIVIGRVNVTRGDKIVSQSKCLDEDDLGLFNMYLQGVPHQASFIRRKLLLDNPYDETLRINADWKFFVQTIVLENKSVKLIPDFVANYDDSGLSSTHLDWLLEEREKVFKDIIPPRIAMEYLSVFPHYYEVTRIQWLLKHPFFYKVYRGWASLGMRLFK